MKRKLLLAIAILFAATSALFLFADSTSPGGDDRIHHLVWDPVDKQYLCTGSPLDCAIIQVEYP